MKHVIIIGGGIAGLTAGVYAQRSGFQVTILEQHSIAGGMCTSWRRKGYLFEGAMHWLTGSSPKTPLHRLWREVGALDDSVMVELPEVFRSIEWEGETIRLYRSAEKTRNEFLRISPGDEQVIRQLYKETKKLGKMTMPIMDVKNLKTEHPQKMGIGDIAAMAPAMMTMNKLQKMSAREYIAKFKHPALRALLDTVVPTNYTASSLLFTLATLDQGDGGFPAGGALALANRMKDTYLKAGGTLRLRTRASKIVASGGRVTGVCLDSGETLSADAVVVAVETNAAVANLFEEMPRGKWLTELYNTVKPSTCTFVGIGVRAELPDTPGFLPQAAISYAGQTEPLLCFNNYHGHKGYAPEGCTALTTVLLGDTYEYWMAAKREGRYEAEKQNLADQIERAICGRWPELTGKIDVIDVATPVTYERYTGAYHGGWMVNTEPGDRMSPYSGVLESIQGVYFAGQRLMPPGGMPGAVATGRTAAQNVCKQFDTVFKTE